MSQEYLARALLRHSINPELDALLVRLWARMATPNIELYFADGGLGPQHAFRVYGNKGESSNDWVFYLIARAGGKQFVCSSTVIPLEQSEDERFVMLVLDDCLAEMMKGLKGSIAVEPELQAESPGP